MINPVRRASVICALLLLALPVFAQSGETEKIEETLLLSLSGELSVSGKFVNVRTTLGKGVTRAIRLTSLPSETVMGVFVTNTIEDEPQQAWRESIKGLRQVMEFPFNQGAVATLQMNRPSEQDTRLAVHIFGTWPGDVEEERVFYVTTNPKKFAFSYSASPRGMTLCCGTNSDGCFKACTSNCANNEYTCCTKPEYNAACGGWCTKPQALCGSVNCGC